MNDLILSELIQIRVTPRMKHLLQLEAERLGVRPVDIARMALANSLYNQIPTMVTLHHDNHTQANETD
jgi:hypothetical protein